jgi:hypothetical protein
MHSQAGVTVDDVERVLDMRQLKVCCVSPLKTLTRTHILTLGI